MRTTNATDAASSGAGNGSIATYAIGYVLSLVLTLEAYQLAVRHQTLGAPVIWVVVALAIAQLTAQLRFFLHLGHESKPRWNLMVFAFMLVVLVILVAGSLWIMNNLNYHTLSPQDVTNSIIKDEGIQP